MAKTPAKQRLNLEVAASVRERLESLRRSTEAESLTEVIRRALAVYEFLVKHKKNGARLIVEQRNGTRTEVEIVG